MRRHRCWRTCLGMVLACVTFLAVAPVSAEDCCAMCGCGEGNRKTCRLVCEQKKVTVTCWGCQDEDFCLPGPSTPDCRHEEDVCGGCSDASCCTRPRLFVWTEWIPGERAKLHTRQKLVKRTVTKTVPTWKWVVQDLCEHCRQESPGTASR